MSKQGAVTVDDVIIVTAKDTLRGKWPVGIEIEIQQAASVDLNLSIQELEL